MISTTSNRISYAGNGATTVFSFPFKWTANSAVKVILRDDRTAEATYGDEVVKTITTHYTLSASSGAAGTGSVTMLTAPATGFTLVIIPNETYLQATDYVENSAMPAEVQEESLDKLTMLTQQLKDKADRSLRLTEGFSDTFDTELPITDDSTDRAGLILAINSAGDGLEFTSASAALGGGGLPTPTSSYTMLESDGSDFVETAAVSYSGISTLTGAAFTSNGLIDTLNKIIRITYTAATASLSGTGSSTLRERGDTVTNPTLSLTVTKQSDPIFSYAFYDGTISVPNLIGSVFTSGTAIPNGGTDTQATAVSFSTNRTFRARVIDDGTSGGPTNTDVSVTYSFVYPYYYGAGAAGLTAAAVGGLTKQIINEATNTSRTFTVTAGEVVYFAYPASYGVLTSILDVNAFQTITDWTLRVENITGLDASPVSYNIYEFDNPIGVSGSYTYTFAQ